MTKQDPKKSKTMMRELPDLLKEVGVGREFLDSDVQTEQRLQEIIENLPEPLVSNLHERISAQIASVEASLNKYLSEKNISNAEAKLLTSLMRGDTVVEHAESSGISINTARTHMRALLEKTHSKGQLDLVQKIHNLKG